MKRYKELEIQNRLLSQQIINMNFQLCDKDKQIVVLQAQLGDIAKIGAKKPTTVNRYNSKVINNLAPYDLNATKVQAIVDEKFTETHLYGKAKGVATFAATNLLQGDEGTKKMVCTDTSRKKFIYKDEDGNVYIDINAAKFIETLLPAVKEKSVRIINNKTGEEMIVLGRCLLDIDTENIASRLAEKLGI